MCLIDTHTLIWTLFDSTKLSDRARRAVAEADRVFVSIVSLWEIAIKQNIGKLEIDSTIEEIAKNSNEAGIEILNILPKHLDAMKRLPRIHGDPFDRLIVAQALEENLVVVTRDSIIQRYEIETVW